MAEAFQACRAASQSISAASNGGRGSQEAADACSPRRRAIRRRHSAVDEGQGGRVVTRHILDPQVLSKYLETIEDNLEDTAPEYEPVFTSIYQYNGNSLASFTDTIDDLLLQLLILIKLKVQIPMSPFSIETVPVPLDAETYLGEKKRVHSNNPGN